MAMRRALQIVLVISVIGILFSGTLTYREFTRPAADLSGGCSALGQPGTILGYPPCVYGLVMYTALAIVAGLGLRRPR